MSLASSKRPPGSGRVPHPMAASLLVGLIVLLPFVVVAALASAGERADIHDDLVTRGAIMARGGWVDASRAAVGGVIQIQNFWANSEDVTEAEFRSFAGATMEPARIISALHVLDMAHVVRWSEPGSAAEGVSLSDNVSWAFLREVDWVGDMRPVMTTIPALTSGVPGAVVAVPLRLESESQPNAILIAEIPYGEALERIYPPGILDDFHLRLADANQTFDWGGPTAPGGPRVEVRLDGLEAGIRVLTSMPALFVEPTAAHLNAQQTNLAGYVALTGVVLAAVAAAGTRTHLRRRIDSIGTQEQVQSSEAHYRELFENAGEAILVIEQDGRIADVNPRGQRMLGVGKSVDGPLTIDSLCSPDEAATIRDALEVTRTSGVTQPFSGRLRSRLGGPIDVLGAFSLAGTKDGEGAVIACLVDVTRLRQLEGQLRQANLKLGSKVSELDVFAHTVAHDLRSPLRAITVYAQDLVEDNEGLLGPEGREQLNRITQNVDRMRAMLDALLQYAKAGGVLEAPTTVDVERIVEEIRDEIAPLLAESHAKVVVDEPMPEVVARAIPLKQVFTNLITNAIKHNDHPRPEVRVTAERDGDAGWAFTIADNGPGIPDPEKDRVFDLFTRGGSVRSEGSGVGLAIVRRIIESHGGKIMVRDSPMGGAAFRFTLPDVAPAAANPPLQADVRP